MLFLLLVGSIILLFTSGKIVFNSNNNGSKEKVELKKTYGCLRAADDDMKNFKTLTDHLETTDDQEKPGKVIIKDDLEQYNKNE